MVFRRSIKTRLPWKEVLLEKEIEEAKEASKQSRINRKECLDKKIQSVEKLVYVGDTVLIKQNKSTTKPPSGKIKCSLQLAVSVLSVTWT